ncbi:hypothetical protein [Chelativorans sp. M5D2P16]|uniref:hypothetical protein n=1 Tax=Chelativorans sp. M5D2P16 TaxID=3095678 RepID=UPI002ACAD165|nr:hypothetical protein [Chelativorans sp. M5D2P16]MDZ5696840.1 hypothetical protein [Chelativorans sp. M5D2P16]
MRMRGILLLGMVGILLSTAPSPAQVAEDELLENEEPPFIVEDRPAPDDPEEPRIRRTDEAFVQIRGSWAVNEAACTSMENQDGGGLYVTDTLIRWEDAACSIREIDSEDGAADVHATCATETGRRDRLFHLRVVGEDTLALRVFTGAGEQEATLTRCEAAQ